MARYKVLVQQKENFIVEVEAEGETQAIFKAEEAFGEGEYKETGEIEVNAIEIIK